MAFLYVADCVETAITLKLPLNYSVLSTFMTFLLACSGRHSCTVLSRYGVRLAEVKVVEEMRITNWEKKFLL